MRLLRQIGIASLFLALTSAPARADGFIVPFVGGELIEIETLEVEDDMGVQVLAVAPAKAGPGRHGSTCEMDDVPVLIPLGGERVKDEAVGFEEDFSYAKNFFGDTPGASNSVLSLMSNLLIGPGVGPVRPYVLGGFGLIRPHVSSLTGSLTGLGATEKNAIGYDIGGGVTGMFGRHLGVRGDLRHFHTLQDVNLLIFQGQKLDFWRASVGLALAF